MTSDSGLGALFNFYEDLMGEETKVCIVLISNLQD